MWCSSPRIASHNARAIEVLPVPLGPTNKKAAFGNGLAANLLSTFFALSSPTKSSNLCGRYFSERDAGKQNPSCVDWLLLLPVLMEIPSNRLMPPRFLGSRRD